MKTTMPIAVIALALVGATLCAPVCAEDESDLAQDLTNPVADLLTIPIQMNNDQNVVPSKNDGVTPHVLTLKDVPAGDGAFWSVSVYDDRGYFEKNELDRYVINSRSAVTDDDGSVTIHARSRRGSTRRGNQAISSWRNNRGEMTPSRSLRREERQVQLMDGLQIQGRES